MELEKVKDQNLLSESDIENDGISPRKRDTSRALIDLTRAAKNVITRNNIKLIMIINILTLILFIGSASYYRWYHYTPMVVSSTSNNTTYTIYMNYYIIAQITTYHDTNTTNIQINTIIYSTFFQKCNNLNISNTNLQCSYLINAAFAATIAGAIFLFALILHAINIFQLGQLVKKVDEGLSIDCIGVDKIQVAIFFLYSTALLYSWIEIYILLDFEVDYLGAIIYYAGFLLLYLMTMLWFTWVYKRGLRRAMVNRLLILEDQYFGDESPSFDDFESERDPK